ncbi:WhiB family transcriptional regulator [Kitasatospora sp. CM 4170]|uniref:WhiB family transcriptional regulator n=1 Tax=Kitasatospora aburaviensis TaxID=67265 RepID=A0ABW1F2Y2_9ACTN|nr:WhiB family transcriptional regulator [Kitasatospora sp. CM 4170]WNM45570.1 WhiB family transcriptional regulator [Kitasatospora sp. CM 4170]
MKIRIRDGAERVDIPLRYRAPAAVTAQVTANSADTVIDMIAIERALSGEMPRPKLRVLEAHLAWSLITSPPREAPDRPVADLLGVADRTVVRWRNKQTRAVGPDQAPGGGEMKDRWEDRALCRGGDIEAFFPRGDVGTAARAVYREAVSVCSKCPVAEACLRFALQAEGATPAKSRSGVFGGCTPQERFALYKQRVENARAA